MITLGDRIGMEEIHKEYGGYLPLELSGGKEYYEGEHFAALNKARSAILLAILQGRFSKIFLPVFMCPSVAEFLQRESSVEIEYYNIDIDFLPINIQLRDKQCILWANYFGICGGGIRKLSEKYKSQLIIDNTQAFFCKPFGVAYLVYSCRKFFGVSDGAYLYQYNLTKQNFASSISNTAGYLLETYNYGTNAQYAQSLINEDKIKAEGLLSMSDLTHRILESIDYDNVLKIRISNFMKMHELLSVYNELDICLDNIDSPMVYPFVFTDDKIREKLIEKHVYVPQWWKAVIDNNLANLFEKKLSKYLLPLPIDQRYTDLDIEKIADIVKECM